MKTPRNLLLVVCDDLSPRLGCYGFPRARTPEFDQFASEGSLFARHYSSWPVCGPARACLFTGCRPDTTRVFGNRPGLAEVNPGLLTLPLHLRRAGFNCRSLGKVLDPPTEPGLNGYWTEAPEVKTDIDWLKVYEPEHVERLKTLAPHPTVGGKRPSCYDAGDVDDSGYRDGLLVERAEHILTELSEGSDPFFLAVGFKSPHLPFNCPAKYWKLHDPAVLAQPDPPTAPERSAAYAVHDMFEARSYANFPSTGPPSPDLARKLVHGYQACVSYVDAQVGRLLRKLDQLHHRDDTLVILTADHGFLLGDYGLWGKHTLFDRALHIPLMMRGPSIPVGQKLSGISSDVDVLPTVCSLFDLDVPETCQGQTLKPALGDGGQVSRRAAFSRFNTLDSSGMVVEGASVRSDRYRVTRWRKPFDGSTTVELYDFETDWHERRNHGSDPEYRSVVDTHLRMLNDTAAPVSTR